MKKDKQSTCSKRTCIYIKKAHVRSPLLFLEKKKVPIERLVMQVVAILDDDIYYHDA